MAWFLTWLEFDLRKIEVFEEKEENRKPSQKLRETLLFPQSPEEALQAHPTLSVKASQASLTTPSSESNLAS